MLIQFSLKADELMLACERLGIEQTESSDDFVDFNVVARSVELTMNRFSSGLEAKVQCEGGVSVPSIVIQGVMRMLPYFGRRTIEIGFSAGKMRVQTTIFYHWLILPSTAGPICRRQSPSRSDGLSSVVA